MPTALAPSRVIALGDQPVHHLQGDRATSRFAAAVRVPRKGGDPVRQPSRLIVCDAASGTAGGAFKLQGLMAISFTPDGQGLVAAYRGGEGHLLTRFDLPAGRAGTATPLPWGALMSPDARRLVFTRGVGYGTTYEEDRTYEIVVSDLVTGERVWRGEFDGFETGDCAPVAFLSGDRVLFKGRGRHMTLDPATGSTTWREDAVPVTSPVYLPDGATVIDRPSPDSGLVVADLATGTVTPLAGTGPKARLATPSPSGRRVLVVDEDAGVGLWSLQTGARVEALDPGCPALHLTSATFTRGALCLGTRDGRVLVFDGAEP